jgi:drug/metabolite transporter (DMT)-like permease
MRRRDSSDEVVSTIIPYKNPKALAGHYCGIFSLFPILGIVLAARARYSDGILSLFPILGIVLGAVAIVLGVMGLRYVKENPEAHGTAHAVVAIILGILGLLIGLSCGTVLIFITRPGNFP